MEGRVKELLSSGDFYSAHQLLLSLAQRHERAGKLEQAALILERGLYAMKECSLAVPLPTLVDCYRKWSELPKGRISRESVECLWPHLVAESVSQASLHPSAADEWQSIGSNLTFVHGYFEALTLEGVSLDHRLEFWDECCPNEMISQVYSNLGGGDLEVEPVCWSVMRNLATRNLMAANLLIPALLLKKEAGTALDDPSGALPTWFCLHPDPLVNFCQLLFLLCQRKCPPAQFDALEQHYRKALGRLGGRPESTRLLSIIRSRYTRSNATGSVPNNPLAAMMQMMNGMGMPSASGGARKGNRRNNNFDLD